MTQNSPIFIFAIVLILVISGGIFWISDQINPLNEETHYVITKTNFVPNLIIDWERYGTEDERHTWILNFSEPMTTKNQRLEITNYNFSWKQHKTILDITYPQGCEELFEEDLLNIINPECLGDSNIIRIDTYDLIEDGKLQVINSEYGIEKFHFSFKISDNASEHFPQHVNEFSLIVKIKNDILIKYFTNYGKVTNEIANWYDDKIVEGNLLVKERNESIRFEESHIIAHAEITSEKHVIIEIESYH